MYLPYRGKRRPTGVPGSSGRRLAIAWLLAAVLATTGCASAPGQPTTTETTPLSRLGANVVADYRSSYSADGLLAQLPHLAVHGALSNTKLDRKIRDKWQDDLRGETSDRLAEHFITFGDYAQNRWSIPLYTATLLSSGYSGDPTRDPALATWAERSLRANLLGGPQAWALTYALGTHRPDTGNSGWNPWNDNDGVSGHSFYGAVPFLTAARMADNRTLRYSLFVLSTFPGLARIHDNHHYTSQAYLGWAIALNATDVVANPAPTGARFTVIPTPDGGFAVVFSGHF